MATLPSAVFLNRSTPPHIATLVVTAGLSALAINVFLPSLPAMTEWFDTDYRLIQLSVALYLAVNAVLQIFIGPLSDKYGRRKILLAGTGIYCLATLGCLLSSSIWVFLAFRMFQAFAVVGMVLSRAAVRDMVSQDKAASMIGYVTMGMAVIPMLAPVLGGLLDTAFGWQANFVLLFIVGLSTLALIFFDFGETATPSGNSLFAQFLEYPELLTSPRFWGYALACAFSSGAFFSYVGGAPFVGSEVFGLTPAQLGFYFGSPALGYFFGNYISGRYSVQVGVNRMVLWGALICTAGIGAALVTFALTGGNAPIFFAFMTFVGLGNGLTIPNATAGMLSVRPHLAGTASGLGGAIMLGGGAAMSAYAGTLLTPDTGAWPLLWLMFVTLCASIVAIAVVIRREAALKAKALDSA